MQTGKTTGAGILRAMIPDSLVVPADGFHYYLRELKAMADPDEKVYLRGMLDLRLGFPINDRIPHTATP